MRETHRSVPSILLVDDNADKCKIILGIIHAVLGDDVDIDEANSVNGAKRFLSKKRYNLLILDIVLPITDEGKLDRDGGLRLLERLRIDPVLHFPIHTICITQHSDLWGELEAKIREQDMSLLDMKNGMDDWIKPFEARLKDLLVQSREANIPPSHGIDFAIVTALYDPEMRAVENVFNDLIEINDAPGLGAYKKCYLNSPTSRFEGMLLTADEPGAAAMACLITKLCLKCAPRVIVLSGIAAGQRDAVYLGDVAIAEHCWNILDGKVLSSDLNNGFKNEVRQVSISTELSILAKEYSGTYIDSSLINVTRPQSSTNASKIAFGPWICSPSVIATDYVWKRAIEVNRKVIALDMECYAAYYSANRVGVPRSNIVAIKAISDYADGDKNDVWHSFSAAVSANVSADFILKYLSRLR